VAEFTFDVQLTGCKVVVATVDVDVVDMAVVVVVGSTLVDIAEDVVAVTEVVDAGAVVVVASVDDPVDNDVEVLPVVVVASVACAVVLLTGAAHIR
jgi:hypothetical protein